MKTTEIKLEKAIQLVIMDAIEKGHTNANDLTNYMQSVVFEKAVENYLLMLNTI